ncbi:helix-turn-helix domain-containing protein [Tardiphaga robiniae]|uniref:helix-turn-helix domain-containing protein n=1 Tax=Tardiphaga robiniae TaxID=943830 RepID=UPI00158692B7|nr:helix-turn-helix domain-containing protein [Tardiphaga robiniae]NUU41392.1 helix-turn-helix domain-containing protein [Tardiphaga robiniae]
MNAQLDIIVDTDLAKDPRWCAPSASSSVVSPSASSSLKEIRKIVAAPSASSSVTDPRIVAINRRREAAGLPHDAFARLAGVSIWTWRDLRRGARAPMSSTLTKLNAALDAPRSTKPPQVVAAFHRLVMQFLAMHLKFDIATLLATDFKVQRPSNPLWLQAARIRQMAIYITAVELQVGNADLGRALGDTRANIKFARDQVEERREDGNEVDQALTAVLLQVQA